jgi:hypothetical protein
VQEQLLKPTTRLTRFCISNYEMEHNNNSFGFKLKLKDFFVFLCVNIHYIVQHLKTY